ncbi:MAG: thioredoxin family protein [Bacillota bacterium]|nr:thioredoxin family protein [Bacillota bacterium]
MMWSKIKSKLFLNEYSMMIGVAVIILAVVIISLIVQFAPKPPNESPIDPRTVKQQEFGNVPKLVAVNLDFCPICRAYRQQLDTLKKDYWGKVDIEIYETGDERAEKLLDSIELDKPDTPAYFLLDQSGEVLDHSTGELDVESIHELFKQNFGIDPNADSDTQSSQSSQPIQGSQDLQSIPTQSAANNSAQKSN